MYPYIFTYSIIFDNIHVYICMMQSNMYRWYMYPCIFTYSIIFDNIHVYIYNLYIFGEYNHLYTYNQIICNHLYSMLYYV